MVQCFIHNYTSSQYQFPVRVLLLHDLCVNFTFDLCDDFTFDLLSIGTIRTHQQTTTGLHHGDPPGASCGSHGLYVRKLQQRFNIVLRVDVALWYCHVCGAETVEVQAETPQGAGPIHPQVHAPFCYH